ncbi:Murein DD-endopeptidase MepM [Microbacterium oxydans]|uniref:Murein DD-endopeptidase MepM n=1 Tax=Microbacterium oxydans TaxID=82380 RepID=A0A0F0KNT8_9MICO|nr:peptidoglycan DD-metalloendopeptidase family protein [Microbacterium oxydans]KJL22124.1 Murein DD-endopeptidase MepM [Microbacterium oxydans]
MMCDELNEEAAFVPTAPAMTRRSLLVASGLTMGLAAFGLGAFARPGVAVAAGTYLRPCGNVPISDSWQGHKNRIPPSGEPGTDYSVGRGTPVLAATDGVIVDRKDTTSTATGRYLALRASDGNYIRYLHLDSSAVSVGTSVTRGQVIAYSGASGFGSDNGYGAHVHVSLWIGGTPNQLGYPNTVDFENYVGAGGPGIPATGSAFGPTAIIDPSDRVSLYSIRTDGNLWGASQAAAGAGLSPWQKLGGDIGTLRGRPSVLRLSNQTLAVYARTTAGTIVGSNQAAPGGAFTSWTTIGSGGNGIIGDPATVQFQNGAIGIYAVTDAGSVAGVAQTSVGSAFGGWTTIGNSSMPLLGTPALVHFADNRIALFARSSTSEVFASAQTSSGSTFSAWSALGTGGAGVSTDPAVINDGDRLTVFAGAGTTVSSVSQAAPGTPFGSWVNLGSGPVSIGAATPTVLKTGATYSVYCLGSDGTVWGSTVPSIPAPAGWGQIGSGAALMTALASVRTSAGLNAVYGTTTAGAVVGSGQSVPGGAFSPWATM